MPKDANDYAEYGSEKRVVQLITARSMIRLCCIANNSKISAGPERKGACQDAAAARLCGHARLKSNPLHSQLSHLEVAHDAGACVCCAAIDARSGQDANDGAVGAVASCPGADDQDAQDAPDAGIQQSSSSTWIQA